MLIIMALLLRLLRGLASFEKIRCSENKTVGKIVAVDIKLLN